MPYSLPDYPWQVVGTDHFLLIADYFSRYPEVLEMKSTTSRAVIAALQSIFAQRGIPEQVRTDNGPQYASQDFVDFAELYGFEHATSSPMFPQSNGQAERAVQTIKRLLKRSPDPHQPLLSYRATLMPWCQLSPAELLMGCRIRTIVPQTDQQLVPSWQYLS